MSDEGSYINVVDRNGNTPLHIAAKQKNDQMVEMMLKHFTNVNAQNNWGETVLHIFIANCINVNGQFENNYEQYVRTVLSRGAYVNIKNGKGMTPAQLLVKQKHDKILKILVEYGADLHPKTEDGDDLFQLLIQSSVEINEPSAYENIIEILLTNGFNVNKFDANGQTLLHRATVWADLQIIEVLLEKCARVNCRDRSSRQLTPLHIAIQLRSDTVIHTLLKYGADVNVLTKDGESPLMKAVKKRNIDVIDLLLYYGADVNFREKSSKLTALHMAADKNQKDVITALVKAGADVNIRNALGDTPIHFAARHQSSVVETLLELGAKTYLANNRNRLALHEAIENNNIVGLYYLLSSGQDINELGNIQFTMTSLLNNDNAHSQMKTYILQRLIKLHAANLLVPRLCEDYIHKQEHYYQRCLNEVRQMKEELFGQASMYDFIHMKPESRLMHKEVFLNFGLHESFPIYYTIIKAKKDEALERKTLLRSATLAWNEITNIVLPVLCIEHIFNYTKNDTLKNLIEYAEEIR